MTQLAAATELWLVEGIFDSIAMIQTAGVEAVSLMSCNNYPEKALDELRRVAAEANKTPPKLIFAFDQGAAGVRYTREFVKKAREQGWICGAAQVRPDGEGDKLDWNDLALSDEPKLKAEDLAEYLWNGEVTIAPNASEKAMLIYKKDRYASFPMTFGGRQM
jgi:DNA primase